MAPFYEEKSYLICCLVFNCLLFTLYLPAVISVACKRNLQMRLDIPAKVTLGIFVISLAIRALIWVLMFTGTETTVPELIQVMAGNFVSLSLYYFTLEMAVTRLILESDSIEAFKTVLSKHRCKQVTLMAACFTLQIMQMFIIEVKSTYNTTRFVIFNYSVRIARLSLDTYLVSLFLSLFLYFIKAKKRRQIGEELTPVQRRVAIYTLVTCALTVYRQVFVCVIGILTLGPNPSLDGFVSVNRNFFLPFIDLLTGAGLLYMFRALAQ